MADKLDRTMFDLPDGVNLSFNETLAEPEYYKDRSCGKAMRPVSKCLENTYDSVQVVTYYFFSITIGCILSVLWGIIFGLVNFVTIWVAHPFIKLFLSIFRCFYVCSRACTRMTCDPCFESAAIHYTRIRGGFHVTVEKKAQDDGEKSGLQSINIL